MSENNIKYHQHGEYLLPKLEVPESPTIGVWGERRRTHLREHQHAIYTGMLLSDKLNAHLEEIDRQSEAMFSLSVKQFSDAEGVTEGLKGENQILWVQRMNNLRSCAAEIVCAGLVPGSGQNWLNFPDSKWLCAPGANTSFPRDRFSLSIR